MSHYLVFKVQHFEYAFRGRSRFPRMVEMRRIELLTPCLQGRCSPSWATPPYSLVLRSIPFHNLVKAPRHTLSIVFVALPCSEKAALPDSPLRASAFAGFGRFHNLWLEKPQVCLIVNFSQIVCLRSRSVLCAHEALITRELRKIGGPKWTRTTDLTLIRRAL